MCNTSDTVQMPTANGILRALNGQLVDQTVELEGQFVVEECVEVDHDPGVPVSLHEFLN